MTSPSIEEQPVVPVRGLRWYALTDKGKFRSNNEDAFLALSFDAREVAYLGKTGESSFDTGDFVFAVSDGMGGANAGEFASRIAVAKITQLLPRSFRLGVMGMRDSAMDILQELFTRTHDEMVALGRNYEELRGMGATLSLTWFRPNWMHFAHVGDSRIYFLPEQEGLAQITEDHSYAGSQRRKGVINEREARNHPLRHQLHRALGAKYRTVEPQHGSVGYEPGDRFLICSDGLCDGLWDNGIQKILRNPMPWLRGLNPAEALVRESNSESGRDNITAVVVEAIG